MLTVREQQKLGAIDRDLIAEEPLLHRALAGLSLRPLRGGRIRHVLCAPLRRPGVRIGTVAVVLCAGIAAFVVGELSGMVVLIVAGALISGIGPLAACWWLRRHHPPLGVPDVHRAGAISPPDVRSGADELPNSLPNADPSRPGQAI